MTTMKRKPLVAGNWKMNGDKALVADFINTLDATNAEGVDIVVCPPAVYLAAFGDVNFAIGAQDVSALDNGAHTGDLSVEMLKEVGCKYIIVGHSERREDHGESSEWVAEKAAKVVSGQLTPIICVGEPLEVREAGDDAVQGFIREQLRALTSKLSADELSRSVIAYEPIWAIGTGKTASPEQAQDVHAFIRSELADTDAEMASGMRILYGGSVKPANAQELFGQPDVDGGLIGGASLKTDDFIAICQSAKI
ncbi:triose-phosphate isomerase [Alteromonas sp. H39]|uniref:triose-phosphate isomerase n=1 Tax=Alteromonas sp. H39 TaxID=3389876 RepID=UPI0039E1D97A